LQRPASHKEKRPLCCQKGRFLCLTAWGASAALLQLDSQLFGDLPGGKAGLLRLGQDLLGDLRLGAALAGAKKLRLLLLQKLDGFLVLLDLRVKIRGALLDSPSYPFFLI